MAVKKNKNVRTKELLMEKELSRHRNTDPDFAAGQNFVEEPTGSATMVNLDGRWDFDHPVEKKSK